MTTNMIALVTGANKGIGFATARQLGARGMTVLVGARDAERGLAAERKLRDGGVDARHVPLDVTDDASVARAAKLVEEEYGRLDVLVNNAGIVLADGDRGLPSESTVATLRRVYETNVFGVVAVTNALLPLLRRAPAARIVNVSSEVGSITTMTDPQGSFFALTGVPYPSSKTALNMVTAMYAKELRDTPIKVNAANPGYCATDLNGHGGFRTAEQGAEVSVHLATLPADGPTGLLWGHQMDAGGGYGPLPW
ncbi:SDR family oxidoreductase [Micromonospora sp. NPDC002717]|uniref:SDR family oxidoreductase n=1 Tax=Micromonospora sp. NPDC002717 TaxID=3154424 RepID=UPI003327AA56